MIVVRRGIIQKRMRVGCENYKSGRNQIMSIKKAGFNITALQQYLLHVTSNELRTIVVVAIAIITVMYQPSAGSAFRVLGGQ